MATMKSCSSNRCGKLFMSNMCKHLNLQGSKAFLFSALVSIENVCMGFPRAGEGVGFLSALLQANLHRCTNRQRRREIMTSQKFYLHLLTVVTLLTFLALSEVSSGNKLERFLKKVDGGVKPAVVVTPSKAKQFLSSLKRPKRNLWDRSRPDVQQWIQQFMYMGYDEARLETDLAYWMDHYRSNDQGRQHHYDENSPTGPRGSYRNGADVNYDYY